MTSASALAGCRLAARPLAHPEPGAATIVQAPAEPPAAEIPAAAPQSLPAEPAGPPPLPQMRAFWVDAFHDGAKSPLQIERLVADAQAAGVNTLLVQVRRRGDAYYLRTGEPRTDDPQLAPGFDALQALLDRAHAARPRLEVHAWIATVAVWNTRERAPANSAHVFNRHGLAALGADNWLSLNERGEAWDGDDYKLDPGHPAVPDYLSGVAQELVGGYDVDGLHLDLIRYAGREWGHNPESLARYRAAAGAAASTSPNDAGWQQWRRDQVSALVRRLYGDTTALKPGLKVSAAVIGWGAGPTDDRTWRTTSAYRDVAQDWVAWLEEGIVDVAMPMNYDNERDENQRVWFDRWIAWAKAHKGSRHVVPGVGLFLNEPAGGLAQLRRALAPLASGAPADGVALYSYAVTNAPPRGGDLPATPNSDFYRALTAESPLNGGEAPIFAAPALPPPMPWKPQA